MSNAQLTVIQSAVLNRLPTLGLAPKSKVLDAPCGGTAALTLALRERGFDAIGADIDPEAAMALGRNFVKANLDGSLPWPDQTFDLQVIS